MESAPHVDFQGLEPSDAIRAEISRQIAHLEEQYGRITACRVTVRAPSGHHRTGGQYEIKIFLTLPDQREVSVDRTPSEDERYQNLDFALNDAFKRARRQLQEETERMRGEVRQTPVPVATVKSLMRDEGYGFLESADGREIYFHEHSVAAPGFEHLTVGARVRFVESQGRDGPQASHVEVVS